MLTGDETWDDMFGPQEMVDNKQWKQKKKKKSSVSMYYTKRMISTNKMLHLIFFNSSGMVLQVLCPMGHTVIECFCKNYIEKA